MSEASEKQTAILLKNGFNQADIERMNKKAISDEIGKILGNNKKSSQNVSIGQIGATGGISKVEHDFQSEYEFGPAGQRHKIKYRTIKELKMKMQELEDGGFFIETVKV